MTTHNLKIKPEFAKAVLSGEKTFEVRKNDRGYQKGDLVRFRLSDPGPQQLQDKLSEKVYQITYILSGWGIDPEYVVFSIKEVSDSD